MKWLTLATVVAAVGSFAVLLISARALSNDVNLQFVAFWGLFFALTGVLGGLMQETTRAVGAADAGDTTGTMRARPIVVALGVGAVVFVIMAVTGVLWAPLVVAQNRVLAIALMSLGLGLYAIQAATSGLLSGRQMWAEFAALIMIDIVIRVVVAIAAWIFDWGLWIWLVITVLGTISWLLLAALSRKTRAVLSARADVPVRRFIVLMLTAMGAAGASAVLITGFPTLVKIAGETVTAHSGVALTPQIAASLSSTVHATAPSSITAAVTIAGIAYAVTLTRAPLLMPLEKFQNAIIVYFVQHRNQGVLVALLKPLLGLIAFGVTGAVLAWFIGPWILTLILDGSYFVSGPVLAALTLGATLSAVLLVTGSVALAVGLHRFYLLGWLLATVTASAMLFIPGHLAIRTIAAISVGSALGIAVHLWALKTRPAVNQAACTPTPAESVQ